MPFEIWLATRPPRTTTRLLRDACIMSAIAAGIDYGATPKRLTPGWELVLSRRSMGATYGAMALGSPPARLSPVPGSATTSGRPERKG